MAENDPVEAMAAKLIILRAELKDAEREGIDDSHIKVLRARVQNLHSRLKKASEEVYYFSLLRSLIRRVD